MYDVDLISTYFPDEAEVSEVILHAARERVVNFLRTHHPDVDTRPGSVVGDLMVGPMTTWLASTELSLGKIMSDLDLGNVAKGVIYNCDFVSKFLGNFSVYETKTLPAGGLLRLVLSEDKTYTLNKEMKFTFGSGDIFSIRTDDGVSDVTLLPSGSIRRHGYSEYELIRTGVDSWSVDIPVVGSMTDSISAGTSGEISTKHLFDELIGISAALDFHNGLPPASLSALAERARHTFQSAGMQSRTSIESHVKHYWPETSGVSAVISGDVEMQRDTVGSPLLLPIPSVDLYVKSRHDMSSLSQTLRLKWDADDEVFRGRLSLLHRPSLVRAVGWSGDSNNSVDDFVIYTQSTAGMMGLTNSGSSDEPLWIIITPPKNVDGDVLVPRVLEGVDTVGYFEVDYITDPLLESYAGELSGDSVKSVGVSTTVKTGPIAVIDTMDISYRKQPGVVCDTQYADDAIAKNIVETYWPYEFSEVAIAEEVYQAGADRVVRVDYTGFIYPSPAHRLLHNGEDFDLLNEADLLTESSPITPITISSLNDLTDSYVVNTEVDNPSTTMLTYAISPRNVRYFVEAENIRTLEI